MRKFLAIFIAVFLTAVVGVPAAQADPPVAFTATATAVSSTQIDLSWTSAEEPVPVVPGAPVGYTVVVSPPGGVVTVTGLTATVTGLTPSTAYSFTITAANGELPDTQATASATTQAPPAVAPGAPTGVTIVADASQTGVIVNWTDGAAGTPAETYTVQVNQVAGGAPVPPQALIARGTETASFPGLTPGTYSATVTAVNAAGSPAASTTVPATVLAPPGAFAVTATAASATSINATWTSAGGSPAATYTVSISPNDATGSVSGLSASFTGLNPNTNYTVTVTAANGAGTTNASDSATTPIAPAAPGPVNVTATVASSTSVNLSWNSVTGNPAPSYSVSTNPAGGTASITGTTATVTGLTPGVNYTFTVTATNGVAPASTGSDSARPDAVPSAPTGLTASNPTATSVDVSWTAPANSGSAITGYRVTANPGGLVQPTGGATSVTFPGLSPSTTYTFTVVAENGAGFSAASASDSATTLSAPAAPGSFEVSASTVSSTRIDLDWPDVSGNPAPTYSVSMSPNDGTAALSGSSADVTGLNPGTTYTFTVTASNGVGSPSQDLVSATTFQAPAAFSVSANPTSSTSVAVDWDPVSGNPTPSYSLSVQPSGGTISLSGTSANVTGLTPGTTYTFTVTATNSVDSSQASASATPVGAPGAPTNVVATRGEEAINTAVVTWDAPSTSGTPVTGYEITVDGREPETIDDPSITSFEIGSLDPGTYTVTVVATSAAGNSPAGVSNEVLIPDVPGILNNIVASNDIPFGRNVTISWQAPEDDGGLPITGYRVTMAGASTVAPPNSNLARIGPLPVGFHTATIQAIGPAGDGPILQSNQVEVRGFAPFVSVDSFINQQYRDFLGRPADAGGRAFWASRTNTDGSNVEAIINSFMESPEFGPRRSVVRLYEAYFGRLPDLAGFDFWSNRLARGEGSLEEISQFFASGPEFQATYGSLTDDEFVDLVYANVLGRAPDAAGRVFWSGQLADGLDRGRLMTLFSESPEFIGVSRAHVDVVVTYRGLLNRLPDDQGYRFWRERIASDPDALGTLIRLFFTSPEYADRITP